MEQEKKRIKAITHTSFEDIFKSARKAIHDFVKPLIALMKVSDWDLDQVANAIEIPVVYAKRSHKKYDLKLMSPGGLRVPPASSSASAATAIAAATACDVHDK
ncbi:hypothetical protein Fot_39103 [Forsythia ovata]|uniref:Uncharacterized protein n=1 Tax=Forsythia ovata TaxID=205694 RepID=A0ABD1S4D9_9LAMI